MFRLLFYALPNNEQGPKYRGLTYRVKQTVLEICRATYSAIKLVCKFNFHLTFSITVVRSIKTPQTTPNLNQTTLNHYRIYSQYYIMREKKSRELTASSGGGRTRAPRPPPPLGPALALCKNTYSDRAKRPPAFLKS